MVLAEKNNKVRSLYCTCLSTRTGIIPITSYSTVPYATCACLCVRACAAGPVGNRVDGLIDVLYCIIIQQLRIVQILFTLCDTYVPFNERTEIDYTNYGGWGGACDAAGSSVH